MVILLSLVGFQGFDQNACLGVNNGFLADKSAVLSFYGSIAN